MRFLFGALLFFCIQGYSQTLTSSDKESIFRGTLELFSKQYHFKHKIPATIDSLKILWSAGRYQGLETLETFTNTLSMDLKRLAADQHLNFFYRSLQQIRNETTSEVPWGLVEEKFLNNGATEVKVLAGDIGYLRIQAFGAFDEMIAGAFAFLQNTRALIIDIRGNGGGMLSNHVISYLLPEDSIHLNTIFWNDRTDSIFTQKALPGPRYLNKPVYVLTDKGTFSSAEEFAYDLQNLKRATIIGEGTGGGANPGGTGPVHFFSNGARLDLYVSLAHVESPVTKTNWEGTGVLPDVQVSSSEALRKAHLLGLEYLTINEKNDFIKKQYSAIKSKVEIASN